MMRGEADKTGDILCCALFFTGILLGTCFRQRYPTLLAELTADCVASVSGSGTTILCSALPDGLVLLLPFITGGTWVGVFLAFLMNVRWGFSVSVCCDLLRSSSTSAGAMVVALTSVVLLVYSYWLITGTVLQKRLRVQGDTLYTSSPPVTLKTDVFLAVLMFLLSVTLKYGVLPYIY